MGILTAAAICFLVIIFGTLMKNLKAEYAIILGIVAGVILIIGSLSRLNILIGYIRDLSADIEIGQSYIETAIKIVATAYLCDFMTDLCKDSGYGALGNQVQVFGKLIILVMGLPILVTLLETIHKVVGSA